VVKVPRHYQVKNQILELIAGLDPGAAVPTERDLAERFGTSRTTLRQAIAELVVEGRLEHTQGRGTFVAQPKLLQVRQLTSFSQDLQEEGRRPGSVILKITREPADAEVSAHLRVDQGTPIHRVERLRTVGDEPIAHEIAHLPEPRPDLAVQLELNGSLYRTLREVFGIELEAVEDIVEPRWPTRSRPRCSASTPGCRCCSCTAPAGTRTAASWSGPGRCSGATGSGSSPGAG